MKPLTHDCWDQSLLDLSGHYSEVAGSRDFYCKVSSLKGVHCVSAGVRDLSHGRIWPHISTFKNAVGNSTMDLLDSELR